MRKVLTTITAMLAFALFARFSEATPLICAPCLFYGGDGFNNDLANEDISSVGNTIVYDNALVGPAGWSVTGIFTNDDLVTNAPSFDSAHWEIRSGMAAGNGGTLVASGDVSGASFHLVPNGQNLTPALGAWIICDIPTTFLTANTVYWFSCTPHASSGPVFASFLKNTLDANSFGTHLEGQAFFDSPLFAPAFGNFVNANRVCSPCDEFSFGVIGTQGAPVPEPASMLLLGTGLAGAGARRWRNRRPRG